MSFDEEHLDEHYECQREVAERDALIEKLKAALRRLEAACIESGDFYYASIASSALHSQSDRGGVE